VFAAGLVGGVGGQYAVYTLQSPCNSNGERFTITVQAAGASAGLGLKCKMCFEAPGKLFLGGKFDDHSPGPNPNAFNGASLHVAASAALLGFGGEYGDTVSGSAASLRSFTPSIGFGTAGAEVAGTIRTVTVTDVKTESCNCE